MIEVFRLAAVNDIGATHWNSLLRDSETNEVFLTHEWISCWWRCFGQNKEPFILVAKEHDEVVGIAPLMLSSRGRGMLRYNVCEFIGTGASDYCDFIVSRNNKENVLREVFKYLSSQSDSWDVISLENVPEHSGTMSLFHEFLHHTQYNVRKFADVHCPTLLIQDDRAFALECTKKKSLRRHFNYFDRSGHITYRTAQSENEVLDELEHFFQQHIERRAIAGGPSKFSDMRVREFYRCLVTRLFPHDWLKFGIVTFNDIPIAYHFGFEYFKKFVWYKPAFNVQYAKKSPGEVLLKYLLEDAIQKQMTEFDFTIGDEPFKRRFSNEIRKNIRIEIVNNNRVWVMQNTVNGIRRYAKHKLPSVFTFLKTHLRRDPRR